MDIITRLDGLTYLIEHSPGNPSPFLLRIVTPGMGSLDKLPTHETRDIFAYGKTLEESVSQVFMALEIQTGRLRRHFSTL